MNGIVWKSFLVGTRTNQGSGRRSDARPTKKESRYTSGSELPEGNDDRKFKGRFEFLGDRVKDHHGNVAVFEEMTSSPAALEARKLCVPSTGVSSDRIKKETKSDLSYSKRMALRFTPRPC